MAKFKKGDRVRVISHNSHVPFGTIGTVLDDDAMPNVEWDHWNNGHSGPFIDGRKTVWTVYEFDLDLVSPEEAQPGTPEETFRDRLAMAALAVSGANHMHDPNSVARYCYEIADAMLRERAGK